MWDRAISYRDLEFDYGFRLCRNSLGRAIQKLVPTGMPRISQNLEKGVFYLYGQDTRHSGKVAGPLGTGFYVARHSDVLPYTYHVYAVSNRHVINDAPWIRVHDRQQNPRFVKLEQDTDWLESKTDDLAVADVTDELGFDAETGTWSDQLNWIDECDFVSRVRLFTDNIGIGDQTIMLGLFSGHGGPTLEIPTGRFGNIGAVPSDENPIGLSSADTGRVPLSGVGAVGK